MGTRGQKSGLTLIEMLAVLAIIMLLVGMLAGVAARITTQGKERLTRDTISLIGNALEQFRDFDYKYKDPGFAGLTFPLDCNNFSGIGLANALYSAIGDTFAITPVDPCQTENSGSEALYFILIQVPDCRKTLDKIDKSLLTNKDKNGIELKLEINPPSGNFYPLIRFIDPWKKPLRYDYYDEWQNDPIIRLRDKKTFPVITSAGADRRFGTNDDISNIQAK
jgi:type II secretory pathway pseudopilin PulG